MPQNQNVAAPELSRHMLWLTVLVAASIAFTLGFACAVPFAAFGAATALTLDTRDALLLTVAMWLVNQFVGFTYLAYPLDASTLTWGAVLGVVAMLSTLAARGASTRFNASHWSIVVLTCFAAAFIVYESSLYLVSAAWLGGTEDFVPAIVLRIFEINSAACIGLLALNRLGESLGLSPAPRLHPRHV